MTVDRPTRPAVGTEPTASVRLELDVAVAQLVLVPAPPGGPLRADASFDPSVYDVDLEPLAGDDEGYRLVARPRGSETWALLRAKVSGRFPTVRVTVPNDVELALVGEVRGGLAALELGGTTTRSVDLGVDGGAVTVSFSEPTVRPLDRFELRVTKGSLEVTGLGHGSPSSSVIAQRLGVLDLDLRGAWQGTSIVRLESGAVGGTLWLPTDVRLDTGDRPAPAANPRTEVGLPSPLVVIDGDPWPRNVVVIE